ncbi:MAG: hypothetical protein COW59_04220 [Lysobacterales bacterium CG17_big_fil_post_rev_8_21_14_2_50_64_11]|nr:MAG: hypothetical protein COW59_04220 [Xanthomonadales bacterium CG17_big_fil_post_rev_8_21_14_2_50_64_11]PIX59232.1 MAG: hypothetical protein COZ47_13565 [Xanthomonadales bacterium CG_4_10_14_3_um_filter_64_11]
MTLTWFDVLGVLGVVLVLGAYGALLARRLRGDRVLFPLLNLLGAAAITVSLLYDQGLNVPALIMQIAWIAISGFGVYRSVIGNADASRAGD